MMNQKTRFTLGVWQIAKDSSLRYATVGMTGCCHNQERMNGGGEPVSSEVRNL